MPTLILLTTMTWFAVVEYFVLVNLQYSMFRVALLL